MTTPAPAAPPAPPAHHWNRWSVFFSLAGLAALVPSFVLPAMLVANALEGPRLFSVMTGIRELWRNEHEFLAGLILVFSVCFPIIKLLLSLLCASGALWIKRRPRELLVWLASWTAKYSMLDVLVVAVLVMTVKVGDYVHVEANQGIYLFCFAIVCSAVAGAMLEMALRREHRAPAVTWRRWKLHALMALGGGAVAWWAWEKSRVESGGMVENIHMERLTKRGALTRGIEATMALRKLTEEGHKFFSQDTANLLLDFTQTIATDAGWQKPEAFLKLYKRDGETFETVRIKDVDFSDELMTLDFPMPQPLAWNDVERMELISNVVYTKRWQLAHVEENVRADDETYSLWTREWDGRIYRFIIEGPRGKGFGWCLVLASAGLVTAFTGASALLAGSRRMVITGIDEKTAGA
jgi:paraquat-inducible protein A